MGETTWLGATIVWARAADVPPLSEAALAAMGAGQSLRLRELDAVRAEGFLAGRALIRDLVHRLGGTPVARLDSTCARCGRGHAAPRTPGFMLSVSHSDDVVAVAVAPGSAPLGIDVERTAGAARAAELGPLFAPGPAPDLAGWTRIEAVCKADGRGIAIDPRQVRLRPQRQRGDADEPHSWAARVPGRTSSLRVATLPGPTGFVLSVARG